MLTTGHTKVAGYKLRGAGPRDGWCNRQTATRPNTRDKIGLAMRQRGAGPTRTPTRARARLAAPLGQMVVAQAGAVATLLMLMLISPMG
jgi:hypothetical protein